MESRLTARVDAVGAEKAARDLNKFTRETKKASTSVTKIRPEVSKAESTFKSFGKNSAAAIATINGPLGGISSRVSSLITVLTAGTAVVTGIAVATTAFAFGISKGVAELDKLNVAAAKTEAILTATGGAVGLTGDQLSKTARDIALNTLASVEGIQEAQAKLLTFNRIQGETSNKALALSQDLAAVFGGTAASQATALGKALQDPVKGITALSRVGVTFTKVQEDQIKLFAKTGESAKAQAIILDELSNQVGGAAEAMATGTLAGALDTMGQLFDESLIKLAKYTGAYKTAVETIANINKLLSSDREIDKPEHARTKSYIEQKRLKSEILNVTREIAEDRGKILKAYWRHIQGRSNFAAILKYKKRVSKDFRG